MFSFFKKKTTNPATSELEKLVNSACEEVKAKWKFFHSTVRFNDDVPLSVKIDMFAQPLEEFFQNKYPKLLSGSSELFWLTLFTAILESNTHSKNEVNEAIEKLRKIYSPSVQVQTTLTSTLQRFANAAQGCAQEFYSNAEYIECELPRVEITDNLRQMTLSICKSLKATRDEIFVELQNWKGESFSSQEFALKVDKVISMLSKNLNDLHALSMSLRAQSDIDQKFGLADMLIGESATNIYREFTRFADIAKEVTRRAQ